MTMQIRIYSLQIIRKKKLTSVSKQMEKLDGKITGSEGIGLTTVQRFVTEGAYVFFTGRCWTVDLKDRQIRVNAISPGLIDTSLAKKVGQPDEIAKAALFLASDDSSYIIGIELFVDGGFAQI